MHQFSHAHSGGRKHIDHSQIAQMGTAIPHHLHGLVGIGFLDGLIGADFVNSPDGAFENIVFVLQPCEKAGKNATDIVDIAAAAPAGLLIVRQILAQIVRGDMDDALDDGMKQLGDGGLVIMQRFFAAALHSLGGEKHFQKLSIALCLRLLNGGIYRDDVFTPKRVGQNFMQGFHLGVVQNGQKRLFDFRNKKLLHVGTLLLLVGCTNILHRQIASKT